MRKRMAHISDTHLDESDIIQKGVDTRSNWKMILEDVTARNIDEIMYAGDIGENTSLECFLTH